MHGLPSETRGVLTVLLSKQEHKWKPLASHTRPIVQQELMLGLGFLKYSLWSQMGFHNWQQELQLFGNSKMVLNLTTKNEFKVKHRMNLRYFHITYCTESLVINTKQTLSTNQCQPRLCCLKLLAHISTTAWDELQCPEYTQFLLLGKHDGLITERIKMLFYCHSSACQ